MGITIRGKYKGSKSYDMGYVTFFQLRRDIAFTVSEEFGIHYAALPKACANLIDRDSYDLKTEQLIKKYHLKERFLKFLYQDDIAGKLSPFMCKALYDQIRDLNNNKLYGYTAYPEYCMTLENFKKLLLDCFNRKAYLEWY